MRPVEERLRGIQFNYRRRKRTRAEELRDLIIETADEVGFGDQRGKQKPYIVTFDRKKNHDFDYWLFDELLTQIDASVGGTGIKKPLNQVRVIMWRKSAKDLKYAIRYYSSHLTNIRFKGLMISQLTDIAGVGLNNSTYRQ